MLSLYENAISGRGPGDDLRARRNEAVARFQRPAERTWTEHYPELGTGPVLFEDSISPAFYELEREAIFKRAWLNVGRMEQLPRNGSYFTKDLPGLRTGLIASTADPRGSIASWSLSMTAHASKEDRRCRA
jgi:hypothetical protein